MSIDVDLFGLVMSWFLCTWQVWQSLDNLRVAFTSLHELSLVRSVELISLSQVASNSREKFGEMSLKAICVLVGDVKGTINFTQEVNLLNVLHA